MKMNTLSGMCVSKLHNRPRCPTCYLPYFQWICFEYTALLFCDEFRSDIWETLSFGIVCFQLECIFQKLRILKKSILLLEMLRCQNYQFAMNEGSSSLGFKLKLNLKWGVVSSRSLLQVLRFVQEWSSLAAMKQKLLRRSGVLFHSPTLGLQQLVAAQRPHSSTKRSDSSWKYVLDGETCFDFDWT